MSTIFDPNTFMDQGTNETGSTTPPICEPGEYPGVIEKAEPKVITSRKDGNNYVILEINWKVQNPEFESTFKRPPMVRQSMFLDMTPDNRLDMSKGKNVDLNRVREALGLNKAGQPFKLSMLVGAGPAKCMVRNKADNKDVMRAEVYAVGKL